MAEELGFIGCLIILALFAVLIYRGFVIAMRSDDKFGSFMVFGIVMRVAVQVLLNVAVVTERHTGNRHFSALLQLRRHGCL